MSHTVGRSSRAARSALLCAIALMIPALLLPAIAGASDGSPPGSFEVQVRSGGQWVPAGTLAYGLHYSVGAIDLPSDALQVRLVQRGGTSAQIDRVSVDGMTPVALQGSSDPLALWKVTSDDDDVADAGGTTLTFTFPGPGSRLTLDARIAGDISDLFPVEYPAANLGRPVTAGSSFYSLDLGTLPGAIDMEAEPFLAQWVWPGSGHPAGFTYVWAARADDGLHITIDFTSDNTCDDADDYATVHVSTPAGVQHFRLSTAETRWGDVSFTYTDKVGYQHKLYEFTIPWSSIGEPSGILEVAFTTYGTVAVNLTQVHRFYNMVNGTHFYTASELEKADVIARLGSTYRYEGIAWVINAADPLNNAPVYRFYNKALGCHFYTASTTEKDNVVATLSGTYTLEGEAFRASLTPSALPVYRFRNVRNGSHFYTASEAEKSAILSTLSGIYSLEGQAFWLAWPDT